MPLDRDPRGMRRTVLLALTLAACSSEPEPADNAASPVVSMTLPEDNATLAATPAGELVTNTCTACHSVEMIRQQPKLSPEQWAATVKKMREAYHAPYPATQDGALVAALVELQAAKP
jgi:sulfite dehydrogenase (cytochrome) subunit B